ncbi:MAG: ABC transporter permease subunit [Phycisphaerales bacterium]
MNRAISILRAVNPLALFFGPAFQKEVRSAGRRKGTYWLRAFYAFGLLAIVGLVFSGMRDSLRGMDGLQRFQTLQAFAPILTWIVVGFQFAMMALMSPILTSPCISEEKRARTLSALMTTPLTSGQIAGGKLASRVVQLVILSLLSTPLLLAIRVFGGLEAEVVLAAACVSISTAILGASLGLMFSIWHRRATTAAMFGLITLALAQGGPTALQAIIYFNLTNTGSRGAMPMGILTTCSPAVLTAVCAGQSGGPPIPGIGSRELWVVNTSYNLVLAAAVTILSSIALRRTMLREASGGGGAATAAGSSARARRTRGKGAAQVPGATPSQPTGEIAPGAPDVPPPLADRVVPPEADDAPASTDEHFREAARTREVGDRPVLWREVRLPTFGSRRTFRIAVGLCVAFFVLLYAWAGIHSEGLQATVAVIGALTVMVQSVFLTTGSVSGEREAKTWEVLLCTPLTGYDVVVGKFLGTLRGQWFVPTVLLAHFALSAVVGAMHPIMLVHVALTFLGPMLFFTALGAVLSLVFKRSTLAAVVNLVVALAIWAGSWIVGALIAWFFALDSVDAVEAYWQVCFAANPIAMAVSAAEPAYRDGGWFSTRNLGLYDFMDARLTAVEFTGVVVGTFVVYAGAAAACLAVAVRAFRKLSGRTS